MSYMPELHTCCVCKCDLGPEDGDGICGACDANDEDEEQPPAYTEQQIREAARKIEASWHEKVPAYKRVGYREDIDLLLAALKGQGKQL